MVEIMIAIEKRLEKSHGITNIEFRSKVYGS